MPQAQDLKTERSRLRRAHERGHYDPDTVHGILDAMPMCHVAFVHEGQPAIIPTLQWRDGDHVYWHGSSASRAIEASIGQPVCLTVTLFDGLVLARSAFNHSANYRSAVLYGTPQLVEDPEEKMRQLKLFVDGLYPDRWDTLRPMTDQEFKATAVLVMPINEASAKIRTGPPKDNAADYELPIWGGEIPLELVPGGPVPDPRNLPGVALPGALDNFTFSPKVRG